MLLDPGCNGQDVGVEDEVVWIEPHPFGEQFVGPLADLHLALDGVRLTMFVESHDHHTGAIALDATGFVEEVLLSLFEADGVDDAFTLDALQPRLEYRPLGAIDHDR